MRERPSLRQDEPPDAGTRKGEELGRPEPGGDDDGVVAENDRRFRRRVGRQGANDHLGDVVNVERPLGQDRAPARAKDVGEMPGGREDGGRGPRPRRHRGRGPRPEPGVLGNREVRSEDVPLQVVDSGLAPRAERSRRTNERRVESRDLLLRRPRPLLRGPGRAARADDDRPAPEDATAGRRAAQDACPGRDERPGQRPPRCDSRRRRLVGPRELLLHEAAQRFLRRRLVLSLQVKDAGLAVRREGRHEPQDAPGARRGPARAVEERHHRPEAGDFVPQPARGPGVKAAREREGEGDLERHGGASSAPEGGEDLLLVPRRILRQGSAAPGRMSGHSHPLPSRELHRARVRGQSSKEGKRSRGPSPPCAASHGESD